MSENKLVKITTVNSLAEAEQIIQYLKENGVSAMRQGGIMDVYTSNSIAGEDIMIDENQLRIAEKLLKEFEPIKVNTSNHKLIKEAENTIMNRMLLGIITIIILIAILFLIFF
ncbi:MULTISPECIES: hypothetical protein [unclassified Ruminococcus]|jgi:hypothetical protein|uniref:hypothetical protein n=1 Tax=unclassified Ruminococcus TaxID=2608920 RepID=UPI00189D2D7B|nr:MULTISPECIES: hypothetical protein [unclassified Ruminococcus]MDB8774083.1 hypothetical protein [Ruminococcus sp. 1001136sp1]MDB8785429.1 hypothetical protein [Ruminococcus sp. 1001136sp1]